jgi:hypothetical protein
MDFRKNIGKMDGLLRIMPLSVIIPIIEHMGDRIRPLDEA